MIKTRFTELVGVEHPIVQGGMQWVGRAELVAAVANAGALGFITALTQPTPDDLTREIARCRGLTDKPFGVNLTSSVDQATALRGISSGISRAGHQDRRDCRQQAAGTVTEFKKHRHVVGTNAPASVTPCRRAHGVDAISIDGFECAAASGEDDTPA